MKATKFFGVATFLFTVATSFFCTSCTDDFHEEKDDMPVHMQQQNKPIYTYVEIADNIADLYDLNAEYVYDGDTIVEALNDMNETEELSRTNKKNEVVTVRLKKYDYTQTNVKNLHKVIITATPKADAVANVEAQSDDTVYDYNIVSVSHTEQDAHGTNKRQTTGGIRMDKQGILRLLAKGKIQLNVKIL